MKGATTFRGICKLCNDVFFSPSTDVPYCNRCARRIGYRPPRPAGVKQSSPSGKGGTPVGVSEPSTLTSAPIAEPASRPSAPAFSSTHPERFESVIKERTADNERPPDDGRGSENERRPGIGRRSENDRLSDKGNEKAKPRLRAEKSPPARTSPLTESLRRSVEHAYQYYAGESGISLKEILDLTCEEFGLDRRVVHEVVAPLEAETARLRRQTLAEEQGATISRRYEEMVQEGLRPAVGRHRLIAKELGIPASAVLLAASQWRWRHHDPRHLSREQRFAIEKESWQRLGGATPPASLTALVDEVADAVELGRENVLRWLDQLYDDPRPLMHVPAVSPAVRESIERAYLDYLERDKPPVESLHRGIAANVGVTVRQAHRGVLLCRWKRRVERLDRPAEEREMVAACVEAAETGMETGSGDRNSCSSAKEPG